MKPTNQSLRDLMKSRIPDHWVVVDPSGTIFTSLGSLSLARTIADCARHGVNHLHHEDRSWTLWSDGFKVVAASAVKNSSHSKSLRRQVLRLLKHLDKIIVAQPVPATAPPHGRALGFVVAS